MIDFSNLIGLPMMATVHTDNDGNQTIETRLPDILIFHPQTTGEKWGHLTMPNTHKVKHEPMLPLINPRQLVPIQDVDLFDINDVKKHYEE